MSNIMEGNTGKNSQNMGDDIISWVVKEYDQQKRSKSWYIISGVFVLLMLFYSFVTANFLFAVIIIVASVIMILHDAKKPSNVKIAITDEGLVVGRKFYDYDDFKNFSIIYKPNQDIKNLYFEFNNFFTSRLSIPLVKENPLPIRENLLKYLPEDLDRTDQPLSEALTKLFKL